MSRGSTGPRTIEQQLRWKKQREARARKEAGRKQMREQRRAAQRAAAGL